MALTSAQQFIGSYIANGTLGIAPGGFMNELDGIINSTKGDYRAVVKAIAGTSLFATKYPAFLSNDQFAANYTANLLGSSVSADAMVAAKAYVAGKLNAGASRGDVMADALTELYSVPSTDATWGTAAATLQNKAAVAVYYTVDKLQTSTNMDVLSNVLKTVTEKAESVTAVKATLDGVTGGTNEAGASYVLTTAQDQYTGTSGNDNFRGVAGAAIGAQDQTTLNSSDIIDGGAGADTLIVNMTGLTYNGGARIKNIETLQIGTNQAAATFDYNVNAGSNEVTEVTTIVADQINVGEQLTLTNILKTGTAIPALKWDNEAASTAGTFTSNFRESAVAGDTEVKLVLDDVKALNNTDTTGRFNLGTGANASVETLRVVSQGSTANTLNASENNDGTAVDLVGASTDGVADNGALKTVIVEGAQAFGKAATVVTDTTNASFGLVNRAVAGDLGLQNADASASNLVSLAATVTTLDAATATGDTNIRFTSRVDAAEVNVTYKGGKANDYVEFQQGNINATGGDGNDTFAFVNTQNNSTLTTADTIVGGAGTDTIQMGVNGVGTYNLDTTEFNNKSGIDVLDLRGATNTVRLADAFVGAADAGLTVRTDKIVQTSDTSTANSSTVTANNGLENASTNTVTLTALSANRAVEFIGGSGSDRIVVNEVSLNSNVKLDGGTNITTTGRFDTITVQDSAVLSRGDLANVKNFEGIVLVKSDTTSARQYTIEVTESFLTNNSGQNNTLQIGTIAAANQNPLTNVDTVTIDVSDLLTTSNALKTAGYDRKIDTTSLTAAGATVQYVANGGVVMGATLQTLGVLASTADASQSLVLASAASAVSNAGAVAPVALPVALTATSNITGTAAAENWSATIAGGVLAGAAVAGGTGTDTLTITDAGTVAVTANYTAIETLVLANGTNTVTFAGGAFQNITGGTGNDSVTASTNMAAGGTVNLGDGNDAFTLSADLAATTLNGGSGTDILTVTTGRNISTNSISGFEVISFAGAATVSVAQSNAFVSSAVTATAGQAITFSDGGAASAVGNADTYIFSNTATSLTLSNVSTVTGGNGNDTVTGSAGADSITAGTGNDSLVGGAGADTLLGGAGDDVIVGGEGADSITGGAGADRIDLTETTAAADTVVLTAADSNSAGFDVITGFAAGAGVDVLSTGTTPTTLWAQTIATGSTATLAADLQNAITAAITAAATNWDAAADAGLITITNFNGAGAATFLVQNLGVDALFTTGDLVVQLVGTTGTLTVADFA